MKRILLAALAALCVSGSGYGATPNKEKTAIKLTPKASVQKKTVKLYKAKDEAGKTTYRCYYKLTAQKGKAYTVWLTKKNSSNAKIRIRTAYGQDAVAYLCGDKPTASCKNKAWNVDEPLAQFEDVDCGVETRWLMSGKEWANDWADDWDTTAWTEMIADDDWGLDWGKSTTPNTWTYYIVVEGVAGATAKLNYVAKKKIPTGVVANPLVIKPNNKEQKVKLKDGFMGDYYYVQANVKGGYCYRFGTLDGTSANKLSFDETYNLNLGTLGPYKTWARSNNQAISFLPNSDQTVLMRLKSSKGYKATGRIRFFVEKQKPITKHKATALTLKKPVTFKPGYLNKPNSGYFDMIVDQQLFSLSAKKGKNYVVETTGARADVPIIAYLYDSKGNILKTNRSKGSYSPDVRVVFTPSKAAKYYIGVCEYHGLFDNFTPKNKKISIKATTVSSTMKTVQLSPVPGAKASKIREVDKAGSSVIVLGKSNWNSKCVFGASAGVTYAFVASFKDPKNTETNLLTATIYSGKISNKTLVKMVTVAPGTRFTCTTEKAGMYYLLIRPTAGEGLDYKPIRVHSMGYFANGKKCGALKVTLTGANGKWKISKKKNATEYASGTSVILPTGGKQLYFTAVKGYTTPKSVKTKVLNGKTVEVGDIYYTDKWDPKDDSTKKATSWTVKAKYTAQKKHTLWKTDKNDCYSFYSKGYHYSFKIYDNGKGDQVFSIKNEKGTYFVKRVTSASRVLLPKSNKKYYIVVSHKTKTNVGGAYKIKGRYEDLGVVKFTKPVYTAKDSATSVTVLAIRTVAKGACRVKYTLASGSAKKGVNYIASTGYVGWKNGDKAKKKITIKLVPKTLPVKSKDLAFKVTLKDASTATVSDGLKKVVQAAFPNFKKSTQATVKITNTAKYKTAADAYASVYTDKVKTLKEQDKSRLRTGTFYGLVRERGTTLTNGAPEFAAVTLTVAAGNKASEDKFTAKVQIAGATYVFKSPDGEVTGWTGKNADGTLKKTLVNVFTRERTVTPEAVEGEEPPEPVTVVDYYTNTLTVAVNDGKYTDWIKSGCNAELTLLNPVEEEGGAVSVSSVTYPGLLYRRNAKIQKYLDAAFLFDGYYTVSLVPGTVTGTDRGAPDAGVPSGRGYLTLTVDNKGGVKVAGLLPDQSAVAASVTACGVVSRSSSKTGYEMVVPVYQSTSNVCFAAELRLFMQTDKKHLDGKKYKTVFDSRKSVVCWNSDIAATEDQVQGWRMACVPVGGWYDLLVNLQGYYNSLAKAFEAGAPKTFPAELLPAGYEYAATPSAVPVMLVGNKFSSAKQSLVADSDNPSMYDFVASVNPCNVKISFNRATGVSSGTSSAWIVNEAEGVQRQLKGFKHFGVLTIDRDTRSSVEGGLAADVLISGAIVRPVLINQSTWMFSVPFEVYTD